MNAVSYTNKRLQAKPVRINSAPRMHVDMGADAVRLQAALLANLAKPRSPDAYVVLTLAGCGLAVAVMAVFGWLPGGGL